MSELIRLRKECRKILKNFTQNEFKRAFVQLFGAENWNEVLKCFKNKQIRTKQDADRAVTITVQTYDKTFLRTALNELQLLDVLLHSRRKKWHAFQLCGDGTKTTISEQKLEKEILAATGKLRAPWDVHVKAHEEVFWMRMSQRANRGLSPIYFAYFVCEDIILATRKRPNKQVLQVIVSALRSENYKTLDLEGNEVWSLLRTIKLKGGKANERDYNLELIESEGNQQELGVDYTKKRKAEVENCFGEDPPILQSLMIKCESGFRAKGMIPAVEGVASKTTLRLNHPNIVQYIKELAVAKVITDPMFYKSILNTGKNVVTLKDPSLRK